MIDKDAEGQALSELLSKVAKQFENWIFVRDDLRGYMNLELIYNFQSGQDSPMIRVTSKQAERIMMLCENIGQEAAAKEEEEKEVVAEEAKAEEKPAEAEPMPA